MRLGKKNSGRGMKRAPYILLDRGVNIGVCRRFKILAGGRDPRWPRGIEGDGPKAMPANGTLLITSYCQTHHGFWGCHCKACQRPGIQILKSWGDMRSKCHSGVTKSIFQIAGGSGS